MSTNPFQFKQFKIEQDQCTMKVGTDGVLLGAWFAADGAEKILDIGTGSGVIALMAAQRFLDATVHAVEVEDASFVQAQNNFSESPWAERVEVFHTPIQDFAKLTTDSYDAIVCNPPFFTGGTLSKDNDKMAVRHTIKMPTGDLLNCSRRLLSKKGKLSVILPFMEGLRFQQQAENYGFHVTRITEVKPKQDKSVERLLLQFELNAKEVVRRDELIIQHEERNHYTDDYIDLTKDFYLHM